MSATKTSFADRFFVNRNVFHLLIGQVISESGDMIYEIGLLWLLLEITGSNATTGLIAMSAYLPTLIFGLFSGSLADRFDRRRVMLVADLARAGLVLLIPLLYYLDGLTGLVLGLVTFCVASFNTLFKPARDSLITEIVSADKRLMANSLIQTSWQYALFAGPALAAPLVAVVGEVHLFTVDALTYLVSFLFIYQIVYARKREGEAPAGNTTIKQTISTSLADVKAGLNYATQYKPLLILLILTAVNNLLLMGPAIIGSPIFLRERLMLGIDSYAYIQIAYAIGMIVGTLLANRYAKTVRHTHLILGGIIFDGITFLPLLWVTSFWGTFITFVFHSMAIPFIIIPRATLIQEIVPSDFQGRIFSMISMAVFGFTAISIALTGIFAEVIPIHIIFAIIAILAALTGVAGWFSKSFREINLAR